MRGKVKAISISKEKGTKKANTISAELREGYGIVGDAHAGSARQVSLLASESIDKMKAKGLKVGPGDFAENITTVGIDLLKLAKGERIAIGGEVLLEVTQHGKECRTRCEIFKQAGDCVMPREGIFARVTRGGNIEVGDSIVDCHCEERSDEAISSERSLR